MCVSQVTLEDSTRRKGVQRNSRGTSVGHVEGTSEPVWGLGMVWGVGRVW
jgi:hypothetical protein